MSYKLIPYCSGQRWKCCNATATAVWASLRAKSSSTSGLLTLRWTVCAKTNRAWRCARPEMPSSFAKR